MSNILKVSTPVSGYDNSTKTNPISANDHNINNVTDLNKVTRSDGRSSNTDFQENRFLLNPNSNFNGFLKILKNMPSTTELMSRVMFFQLNELVTSGINENFAEEISSFLEMIKMSQDDLYGFIKAQGEASAKFSGEFFDVLRSILSQSNSNELNLRILDLLKKYNDITSNKHILSNIFNDISNIASNLTLKYRESLMEIAEKLNFGASLEDTAKNLEILKKEIIPFLSKYIKTTNDFGIIRDFITSLTLNTARYENSSLEGFIGAFESLIGYNVVKKSFGEMNVNEFLEALIKSQDKGMEAGNLNEKFLNILERGIRGELGYENIDIFKGILSSMIINESVYMPFLHIMLPLNVDGQMMFSEIWVDSDEESDKNESEERKSKLLIKFDIKDVGFFDLIILHQGGNIDMQIFCPEKIHKFDKAVKIGLKEILERNGLKAGLISVERGGTPVSISEVFPKIYERKNIINVRI